MLLLFDKEQMCWRQERWSLRGSQCQCLVPRGLVPRGSRLTVSPLQPWLWSVLVVSMWKCQSQWYSWWQSVSWDQIYFSMPIWWRPMSWQWVGGFMHLYVGKLSLILCQRIALLRVLMLALVLLVAIVFEVLSRWTWIWVVIWPLRMCTVVRVLWRLLGQSLYWYRNDTGINM